MIEFGQQGLGEAGQSPFGAPAPVAARAKYAIVGFGGFLGIGEQYALVPFEAMSVDPDPSVRTFYLPTTREAFESSPRFSHDILPGELSPGWDDEFAGFWHTELGWEETARW